MMLYLLLIAATAALELWAAGTKIGVAYELLLMQSNAFDWPLWLKVTDVLCIQQAKKLSL